MYVLIINPVAGRGKGIEVVKEFLNKRRDQHKFKTYYTDYPGHATKLVEQVVSLHEDKIQMLIVVGGDGTIYEVLNGMKKFQGIPLAFVPVGSGNDFARGCGMPLNPRKSLEAIFKTKRFKPYWAGTYLTDQKPARLKKLFASSLGFGFDAEVAEKTNESKWKRWFNRFRLSCIVYVFGLISTIFNFKPKNFNLTIDGKTREMTGIWMLTITNHPYFGGGMKIAPDATINKQTFHVTIVHQISKMKLLLLFLTVFFGQHTRLKEVETLIGSEISIKSKETLTYHADGFTGKCFECEVMKEPTSRNVVRKI